MNMRSNSKRMMTSMLAGIFILAGTLAEDEALVDAPAGPGKAEVRYVVLNHHMSSDGHSFSSEFPDASPWENAVAEGDAPVISNPLFGTSDELPRLVRHDSKVLTSLVVMPCSLTGKAAKHQVQTTKIPRLQHHHPRGCGHELEHPAADIQAGVLRGTTHCARLWRLAGSLRSPVCAGSTLPLRSRGQRPGRRHAVQLC
jgi:hypothetical protein